MRRTVPRRQPQLNVITEVNTSVLLLDTTLCELGMDWSIRLTKEECRRFQNAFGTDGDGHDDGSNDG